MYYLSRNEIISSRLKEIINHFLNTYILINLHLYIIHLKNYLLPTKSLITSLDFTMITFTLNS